MVEDIITVLSRFRGLFVIARNSSFTYKGRAVDVKQVDRGLVVRFQQMIPVITADASD
jgi:adenylate cyclase